MHTYQRLNKFKLHPVVQALRSQAINGLGAWQGLSSGTCFLAGLVRLQPQEQPGILHSVSRLALTGFVITSTNFRVIRYPTDQGQT